MDYITFVLGYDLLHDYFTLFEDAPCDSVYEICNDIAREFNMYDLEHPTDCSEYEALQNWLADHMEFVWDKLFTLGDIKREYLRDAIFCGTNELLISYLNPDASVPTWEEARVKRQDVLDYLDSLEDDLDVEEFLCVVVDGAKHYTTDYIPEHIEAHPYADFHANGDASLEVNYIINWAKEA